MKSIKRFKKYEEHETVGIKEEHEMVLKNMKSLKRCEKYEELEKV